MKLVSRYKLGPLFTPPVVSKWEGPLATLMLPNITGGANWQGGSFDPETKMFYIFTNTNISALGLVPGNARATWTSNGSEALPAIRTPRHPQRGRRWRRRREAAALTVQGLPLVKPPYGQITAHRHEQGRACMAGSRTARRPITSGITRRSKA